MLIFKKVGPVYMDEEGTILIKNLESFLIIRVQKKVN